MAKFKIVTTAGPGTGVPGADHSLEMEALAGIGAEIVEEKILPRIVRPLAQAIASK